MSGGGAGVPGVTVTGAHTLVAIASDASGKQTRSAAVGFTAVSQAAAKASEPAIGACLCTQADGSASFELLLGGLGAFVVGLRRRRA